MLGLKSGERLSADERPFLSIPESHFHIYIPIDSTRLRFLPLHSEGSHEGRGFATCELLQALSLIV